MLLNSPAAKRARSADFPQDQNRRTFLQTALAAPLVTGLSSSRVTASTELASSALLIERLAWAGIKLQCGSVTLLIDARAPDPDNGVAGPVLESSTPRTFALATHHHGDHCDLTALKPVLGDSGYLVVINETAQLLDRRVVNIEPVQIYEPALFSRGTGDFVAWPVPAVDGLGSPQVSWVVDVAGKRLIHCGDTLWHGYWWNIARAYGPFDVAFLPINGFRQNGGIFKDVGEPMGMTPEQAVHAAQILRAKSVVPIHFGNQSDAGYFEVNDPLGRFLAAAAGAGIHVQSIAPGHRVIY